MGFFKRIIAVMQESKKRELLHYLNGLPDSYLESLGFSPELVRQGVSAWPWSNDSQTNEMARLEKYIEQEQASVSQLKECTDAELSDLGISRLSIEQSVRFGRVGIERHDDNEAA